jgi:hypothetical protein
VPPYFQSQLEIDDDTRLLLISVDVQPRHRSKLFTVEARKRLPYPDTASAAVCIGDMRRRASPRPQPDSVAQKLNGECRKPMNLLLRLVRPVKPAMGADEPERDVMKSRFLLTFLRDIFIA